MEVDNEVKGNGNSYTTEFRQYDPRLGRWLSLDPLMMKYPSMSPYVAFNNNPIFFVDPLGLEGGPAKDKTYTNPTSAGVTVTGKAYSSSRVMNNKMKAIKGEGKFAGSGYDKFRSSAEALQLSQSMIGTDDSYTSTDHGRNYEKNGWIDVDPMSSGNSGHKGRGYKEESQLGGTIQNRGDLGLSAGMFVLFFEDGGVTEVLLHHYGTANGDPYDLTQNQIREAFPNCYDQKCERPMNLDIDNMTQEGTVNTGEFYAYTGASGSLGQFTMSMTGEIRSEKTTTGLTTTTNQMVFRGVITIYDHFDFEKRKEGEKPREGSAGFQTWVGRTFIMGTGFDINGSIEVMQVGNGPLTDLNGNVLHRR